MTVGSREIPNLMQLDQRLGELKSGASKRLKEMDSSTCYYSMIEDSSVITPVSVKSLVNNVAHLAAGCILIKGAPDEGKSFLLAKLLRYWALGYGMRNSTLVFWVDCSQIEEECDIHDLYPPFSIEAMCVCWEGTFASFQLRMLCLCSS